jgi:hypothetical protein
MDDAMSTIYSAFLIEKRHGFEAAGGVHGEGASGEPLYPSRQPLFLHGEGGGGR